MGSANVDNARAMEGRAGVGTMKITKARILDGRHGQGVGGDQMKGREGIMPNINSGPQNSLNMKRGRTTERYSGPPHYKSR